MSLTAEGEDAQEGIGFYIDKWKIRYRRAAFDIDSPSLRRYIVSAICVHDIHEISLQPGYMLASKFYFH